MLRALLVLCCACAAAPPAPVPPVAKPAAPPPRAPDPWSAKAPGPAQPAWIGIWPDPQSTRVLQVVPGGPASRAGIQLGDEIASVDGRAVTNGHEIVELVRALPPGKAVQFVLHRAGKELALAVTPDERPTVMAATLADKPAPAFALAAPAGGAPVKLADQAGHVVVLEFWATWCGPCSMTSPHLDDWHRKYADLRVIGITDEDSQLVQQYVTDHGFGYQIAIDPDDHTNRDYLVQGLPTIVVIDKAGIVRYVHIGVPDFDEVEGQLKRLL
jgi:thiol-disulfide isomerase/thioredoxin